MGHNVLFHTVLLCFHAVVGFNPISYTVMEGMVMPFVRLSLFRQGNVDLTATVSIMTVPGTAMECMYYTVSLCYGLGELKTTSLCSYTQYFFV